MPWLLWESLGESYPAFAHHVAVCMNAWENFAAVVVKSLRYVFNQWWNIYIFIVTLSNVEKIMFQSVISLLGNNILQDAKEMEHRKTMINLNDSIPLAKKLCAYSITNPFYLCIYNQKYAIKVSSLNHVFFIIHLTAFYSSKS